MSAELVTVHQAAQHLKLHPKTVLRYIRDGQLPATRVGKSYRIVRAELNAFAGEASAPSDAAAVVRTTCIVDIPQITAAQAERLATFLQSAALAGPADTPSLHLQTAFDPLGKSMKVVLIGGPFKVAKLLEMLELHVSARV